MLQQNMYTHHNAVHHISCHCCIYWWCLSGSLLNDVWMDAMSIQTSGYLKNIGAWQTFVFPKSLQLVWGDSQLFPLTALQKGKRPIPSWKLAEQMWNGSLKNYCKDFHAIIYNMNSNYWSIYCDDEHKHSEIFKGCNVFCSLEYHEVLADWDR